MASLNRVMLIGNLTKDPELRYTTSGTGICAMRLAVHRRFRVDGHEREETCYVDVDAFGRQAETCNQYLSKGSGVLIEGRLRYDEWDDRDTGRKRSKLQVIAERVQFMPRSDGQRHDAVVQPSATQQLHVPSTSPAQLPPSATQPLQPPSPAPPTVPAPAPPVAAPPPAPAVQQPSVTPPAPQPTAPPVAAPVAPVVAPPPPVFPSSTESIDDIPF